MPLSLTRSLSCGLAASLLLPASVALAAGILAPIGTGPLFSITPQLYPVPISASVLREAPFSSMGYIETQFSDSVVYRGSAVIARSPQLIYTAAHVAYDNGVWTSDFRFKRAWNDIVSPDVDQMAVVRGYHHYANYGGTNLPRDFAKDFAVGYRVGGRKFGPALPVSDNAVALLAAKSVSKSIHGYPATRDFNNSRGFYFQHQTGPFLGKFAKVTGPYRIIDGVTTGPGNSGGGVVLRDGNSLVLAGILVSGSSSAAGIHSLDNTADNIAKNALVAAGFSPKGVPLPRRIKEFQNSTTLILPNGTSEYSNRTIKVRGMPKSIVTIKLTLDIASDLNDDMDIYLRSPRGRIHWIKKSVFQIGAPLDTSGDFDNLFLKEQDYSSTFAGQNPNGNWKLYMRDLYAVYYCAFRNATLQVGSR